MYTQVKNVDKLIDAALEEKANESSAKDVKSVADLFKEVVDKETDPFNFWRNLSTILC